MFLYLHSTKKKLIHPITAGFALNLFLQIFSDFFFCLYIAKYASPILSDRVGLVTKYAFEIWQNIKNHKQRKNNEIVYRSIDYFRERDYNAFHAQVLALRPYVKELIVELMQNLNKIYFFAQIRDRMPKTVNIRVEHKN